MMNKNKALKLLFFNISQIKDAKINIYLEELNESQFELYLNNKILKKRNIDVGINISILYTNKKYIKYFRYSNYEQLISLISQYLKEILNYSFEYNFDKKDIKLKKISNKLVYWTNQKKYNVMKYIKSNILKLDYLKIAFYEKKEKIYIITNINNDIKNINNFYTKLMIDGTVKNKKIFDFLLSDDGYKKISKLKILNLINHFNESIFIKIKSTLIENGSYDLILSNRCGTVFHEMFGHNLELDLIDNFNLNLFNIGNSINNPLITYIDDPCKNNLLDLKHNDLGERRVKQVLIKDGMILKYLDKQSLRRENYKYNSATRMSNTYIITNKKSNDIKLNMVKRGIYIKKIKSGRLFLEIQKFKIDVDCGYFIENGKIISPISDLSFFVDVRDFIKKIIYIGKDLDFVPSVCGSISGNVFVYAGCPTVYVKDIYIYQK